MTENSRIACCHRLTMSKKRIFVQVDQKIPDTTAGQFAEGVDIGDEKRTLPADLKILGDREAELTDFGRQISPGEAYVCVGWM